jgi:hypothetical protein
MIGQEIPELIGDEMLSSLDRELREVKRAAATADVTAKASAVAAEDAARKAANFTAMRDFVRSCRGMSVEQMLAEAGVRLEAVEAELAEEEAALTRLREHVRDLQGFIRVREQLLDAAAEESAPDR